MSKKIVTYCDHCKKKIKGEGHKVFIETERLLVLKEDFDICEDCNENLEKMILTFFGEIKGDEE